MKSLFVTTFAHALSIVGYPYILVPATVALSSWVQRESAHTLFGQPFRVLLIVMASLAFFAWRGVRAGRHSNFDMSKRTERTGFYGVTVVLMIAATALMAAQNPEHAYLRPMFVATALLATSFVVNSKLKVSLHATFAVYSAGLIYGESRPWAFGLGAFALMIGWSRIYLKRHSLVEVVAGLSLGLIGALVLNQ